MSDLDLNLGEQVMEEALAPKHDEREQGPVSGLSDAQGQSRSASAIQSLIGQKQKQIKEIEQRIETHRDTGAYSAKDEHGNPYFDFMRMQEDNSKVNRLQREVNDLKDQQRDFERTSASRTEQAKRSARATAEREKVALDPELWREVATTFTEVINGMTAGGEWAKAKYSDATHMEAVITQAWEASLGHVVRRRSTAKVSGNPASQGFDGSQANKNEAPPAPEDDPFTNNLMYAYERRAKRGMTFAEQKRAQAGNGGSK